MNEHIIGLEDIARQVLRQYDINPVKIQIIQQGGIKTVWKVLIEDAVICLKRLNKTYEKALFAAEAQKYIKANGGFVPGIIANKANELITNYNGEIFVLYEWIEGKQISFNNKEEFMAAMEGLAIFHKYSKGYKPPEEARESTKLLKWPEQYRSMLNRMNEWKNTSYQKAGIAVYDAYLKWVDKITALGEKAILYLESSQYKTLSNPEASSVVLCHQDFGKGNALLTPEGLYVLDLDGVTFELAARDLRKIILKTMENRNEWDEAVMNDIISWYEKGNALAQNERKMIYIDLLFPHGFFGCVKNQFLKNKPVKASSVELIGRLEMTKEILLSRFIEGE